MPEPLALLACASTFTNKIKLGTCVYVLPVRHPLATAKLTSTLDQMSGGRLIFGVGVGWREDEFKAVGVPFSQRGRVADECLQITQQAWRNGEVHFQGKFFNISKVRMELRPKQKPIPIWVGGNGKQAATRAAKFAECWIPTDYSVEEHEQGRTLLAEACNAVGRDQNEVKTASHLMVIIDQSRNQADELARQIADSLHEDIDDLKKWAIVGDSAVVTRRLEEYNAVGVGYHVLDFATKVRDEERIQLFVSHILPSFKQASQ